MFRAGSQSCEMLRPLRSGWDHDRVETRVWFFQANTAHFDIDTALEILDPIWWRVPQYASDIQIGDVAVLWRSGKSAGIVGLGRISSDPQQHPINEAEKPFVVNDEEEGAA